MVLVSMSLFIATPPDAHSSEFTSATLPLKYEETFIPWTFVRILPVLWNPLPFLWVESGRA